MPAVEGEMQGKRLGVLLLLFILLSLALVGVLLGLTWLVSVRLGS